MGIHGKLPRKKTSSKTTGTPRELAPIRWSYDKLNTEYAVRQNPLPAPAVGIFDAPYACLNVNKSWLSHILGVTLTLLELDAWSGDDDETFRARQEIEKFMAQTALDCDDLMPCCDDLILEIQQVKNEIIKNTYNNTYNNTDIDSIVNNYSSLQNIYNNSLNVVLDIAPDLVAPTANGDNALCNAIAEYIDQFCESILQVIPVGAIGLSIVGIAVGVLAALPTAGASIPLAIAGAVAIAGGGLLGLSAEIYKDKTARAEIACCVFDKMVGLEPTQANFNAAFNGSGCDLSTNAGIILSEIQNIGLANTIHAAFLERVQQLYELGESGLLSNCSGCDNPEHFIIIGEADNLLDVQFNSSSGFRQLWIYTNRTGTSVGEDRVFIEKDVACFPMFEYTSSAFPPSNFWNTPCGGTESAPEGSPPPGTSMHRVGFASWINGSTILQIYVTDAATFEIRYL